MATEMHFNIIFDENSDGIEEHLSENSEMSSSDSEDSADFIQDGHQAAEKEDGNQDKPPASYIALISMAILSSPLKKMLLSEIYKWIYEKYPYFKLKDRSWRNSVRHNLSLNECFIKVGRSNSGKGSFWSIHPANVEDFSNGDFRRRRARRRVRKCEEMQSLEYSYHGNVPQKAPIENKSVISDGYVPMTSSYVSLDVLAQMFGMENVTAKVEETKFKATPKELMEAAVPVKEVRYTEVSAMMDNPVTAMMSPAFLAMLSPANSDTSPIKTQNQQYQSYAQYSVNAQYRPVTVNMDHLNSLPQDIPDTFLSPLSPGDFQW